MLRSGRFAVTAELNAADSADPEDVYRNALVLSQVCDAINATDGSGANCHMSSLGCCALLTAPAMNPCSRLAVATATASPSRATSWAQLRWACTTSSASPVTM